MGETSKILASGLRMERVPLHGYSLHYSQGRCRYLCCFDKVYLKAAEDSIHDMEVT